MTIKTRTPGVVAAADSGIRFVQFARARGFHPAVIPLVLIYGVIVGVVAGALS